MSLSLYEDGKAFATSTFYTNQNGDLVQECVKKGEYDSAVRFPRKPGEAANDPVYPRMAVWVRYNKDLSQIPG
jgi:hypothetical protein